MARRFARFGLACALGIAFVASMLAGAPAEATHDVVQGKKICVDAGHGGSDPGR